MVEFSIVASDVACTANKECPNFVKNTENQMSFRTAEAATLHSGQRPVNSVSYLVA